MKLPLLTISLRAEVDVVVARQSARKAAELLRFDTQDQTRIGTAVSEIARNACRHAGGGSVEMWLEGTKAPQTLVVHVIDKGKGIAHLAEILEGRHRTATKASFGMIAAKRLMDRFDVRTSDKGTVVELAKVLGSQQRAITAAQGAEIAAQLTLRNQPPTQTTAAVLDVNQELLRALEDLRAREEEAERLNEELQSTNRGVVALYAELDDKAEQLRLASETKSRFLSNMSHEFRTPLNSVMALSRLLLDRVDGDLTSEQVRQVNFIRQAADNLTVLVNDLLDIAKVEAGKVSMRLSQFYLTDLFGSLRGALKPLQTSDAVALIVEEPPDIEMISDEGKVSQILRNLISNALKFTETGEVRISARRAEASDDIVMTVRDTGIGIPAADRERIFEEFVQAENNLQRRVKGTGLGLPLSRKLAELLGGRIWLESSTDVGSTFFLQLPTKFFSLEDPNQAALTNKCILIIDDEDWARYALRQMIAAPGVDLKEAAGGIEGLKLARSERPDVIILDLAMPQMDGFSVLRELQSDPDTRDIPVIISTSQIVDEDLRAHLPGARAILSKENLSREIVTTFLREAIQHQRSHA